jgi:Eukaryotic translation initiation factor 3 subunit 8 N-terminus
LYIRSLVSLEDLQNEAYEREKAAKKKMNATNARALNTFRQRIRKNNRDYEDEIKRYREDPTSFDTESEDEAKPAAREVRDEILGPDGQVHRGFIAAEEDDEGFATVDRRGKAMIYTADGIFKHLKLIQEARGKRSTDRTEQVKILEKLKEVAVTPYQKIRVLLSLISGRFDYNPMALFMPIEQWNAYFSPFANLSVVLKTRSSCSLISLKSVANMSFSRIQKRSLWMMLRPIPNLARLSKSVDPSYHSLIGWMTNSQRVYKTSILTRQSTSKDSGTNRIYILSSSVEECGLKGLKKKDLIPMEVEVEWSYDDLNISITRSVSAQ